MTFSVNLRALAGLPLALDRRAADLAATREYFFANTKISTFGLVAILGTHERVVVAVDKFLGALATAYAADDAARLRAVVASYQASDQRAAARADAAVPGAPPGSAQSAPITAAGAAYGPEIFADRYDPTVALIPPDSHISDISYQPSWSDLLSPGSMGRDAIWEFTSNLAQIGVLDRPIDPFAALVMPFVGDWPGLRRCADVFDQVAAALDLCGQAIGGERLAIPAVWTGSVAGIGQGVLGDFATVTETGAVRCRDLAGVYRSVAQGVQDNANLLETLVTDLVDLAADGVLDIVTAGVFAAFSIGDEIRDFMSTLKAVSNLVNKVLDLVSTGRSVADNVANRFGILAATGPLPAADGLSPHIPVPVDPPPRPRGKQLAIPWQIWDAPDA